MREVWGWENRKSAECRRARDARPYNVAEIANGEMRLQRWAASLQRLDAFATDGCIAVPRRGAHCAPVSYIAAPVTVITTMFRESARRVIGATAKPLYPIDGKAAGLDRRSPQDLPLRGRGTAAAVEGVSRRWKESAAVEGVHHVLPKIRRLCFICFVCLICLVCPRHMMFFFKNHQVSFRRMSR